MIISYGKRFKNIESTWYFGRLYLYLFLGLYYLITYSIMIQKTFQKLFLNFTFKINNVFIDLKKKNNSYIHYSCNIYIFVTNIL